MPKRVAIYLRVSTSDQDTENQRLELESWAACAGYTIVSVYEDHGVSGSKSSDQRPQLSRLLKDATRRRFDMVACWALDRLGRSLKDLLTTLETLHGAGVDLFLHRQAIDTSTPAGRMFFSMLGAFGEFEREMIRERVFAGLARAKVKGTKSGMAIGRPAMSDRKLDVARAALAEGKSVREAAALSGVSKTRVGLLRAA